MIVVGFELGNGKTICRKRECLTSWRAQAHQIHRVIHKQFAGRHCCSNCGKLLDPSQPFFVGAK